MGRPTRNWRMKNFRVHLPVIVCLLGLMQSVAVAGLPAETTVTVPTKFEILRENRVSGTVMLAAGSRLEVIELAGDQVRVRYRSLAGRVPAAQTELAGLAVALQTAPVAKAETVVAPPVAPASTPVAAVPATPLERALSGKLVKFENGGLQAHNPAQLAGVKFYAIYFSASWCGPCRQFTPELVDAYGKIRAQYPEFELVFVSNDRSATDMQGYMRDDHMAWPALRFEAIRNTPDIVRYAGPGIPCLVLVDANGQVLSDSFRGGNYAGPDAVLDDTWRILRDHRRQLAGKKT